MEPTERIAQLTEDVAALSRRVRLLGGLSIGFLVVAVALVAWALVEEQGPAQLIEVRELRVVDEDGDLIGRLGTTPLGDSELALLDDEGRPRFRVRARAEHSTLEILDAGQRTLVRLSGVPGLTSLHLAHAEGGQTAQLQAGTDNASLMIVDLDRTLSANLRADPDGTELVLSRAKEGEPARAAMLSAGGQSLEVGPSLTLGYEDRRGLLSVPDEGAATVVLEGPEAALVSDVDGEGEAWIRSAREDQP